MKYYRYPFVAVLGQQKIKNALIWNMINPLIGGVLISGEKGTAKSTLVRAIENLTNQSIIEIPLNITEDRLVGGIDFEMAIKNGKKTLERGLLDKANGNILYVDEVNLLSDDIVKVLLEVAGNKICRVEREGISDCYDSSFILIGSMNPEESSLRSQFIDRFGLYVKVISEDNVKVRKEIIRRRIQYEANPAKFIEQFKEEENVLRKKIQEAIERLPRIKVSESSILFAADLVRQGNCDGHRAEIILIETAKAIAAYLGYSTVNKDCIVEAAQYVLPHRVKETQNPNSNTREEQEQSNEDIQNKEIQESQETLVDFQKKPNENKDCETSESDSLQKQENNQKKDIEDIRDEENTDKNSKEEQNLEKQNTEWHEQVEDTNQNLPWIEDILEESEDPFQVTKWLEQKLKKKVDTGSGKRSIVKSNCATGRYVRSVIARTKTNDIAFDATVRAAAPYQVHRHDKNRKLVIKQEDIRKKVRERRTGNCILFVLDASGSMGVGKRMGAVKGAILSLLSDTYQKRDKVGLITFRKDKAELNLPITHSVELAQKKIDDLPTGGKTPICMGLELAHRVIKAYQLKEKDILPVIVLITDGRATYGYSKKPMQDAIEQGKAIVADKIHTVIIDTEQDFIKLNLAAKLADVMEADLYDLDDLRAENVVAAVKHAVS